jgi:xeroderma pigmentosum group C-complementing protein
MTASEGASSSLSPSLLGDNYARATAGGAAIFTIEQTDIFVPEPVVDGVVPKNRFGNIDVYVASMVPAGGTHLVDPLAGRAASIMGVDFAPALTGFQFRGSHGTALLHGVVVATEYVDAVKAVIDGLRYAEAEEQREMRVARALRMWRRFLLAVRIYDRICAPYVEVGKEDESSRAMHRAVGVHPEETRRDSSPSANFHTFSKGVSVGHDNHYSQYPSLPDDGTMPPDGDDDDDYAGSGGFIIE